MVGLYYVESVNLMVTKFSMPDKQYFSMGRNDIAE